MDPRFESKSLYDVYRCQIRMRDKLCGGIPKNKELLADAVRAHTGHDDAHTAAQIAELGVGIVDEIVEKSWNGFVSDDKGMYLPAFQIKAMFKECASLCRLTTEKRGSKQILQHGTFVVKAVDGGDRVHFGKTAVDGCDEGPVHVMTAQGPRTAIKRVDYVERVDLTFDVWVFGTHAAETRHIGESDVIELLRLAQENGLGADRSQGKGTFDVVKFERVAKATQKEEKEEAPAKPKKSGNAASAASQTHPSPSRSSQADGAATAQGD